MKTQINRIDVTERATFIIYIALNTRSKDVLKLPFQAVDVFSSYVTMNKHSTKQPYIFYVK